jgi:hypothetical protein
MTLQFDTTASTRSLNRLLMAAMLALAVPGVAGADCAPGSSAPCDDGRACTTTDRCIDGACVGVAPAVPATCDWAVVSINPSGSRTRVAHHASIDGSVCGQRITISGASVAGNVATTTPSGAVIDLRSEASVGGTVVNPTRSEPGEPGTVLGDCQDAAGSVAPAGAAFTAPAFRSSMTAGKVSVAHHGDLTLTATGPVNVIDFDSLVVNESATITIDAGAFPDATFVLRVSGDLSMKSASSIVLVGGAAPERVILFGQKECRFARNVTGSGTVFCPNDSIRMDSETRWTGAIVGGGDRIDLRHHVEITHVPSEVPAF